MAYDDQDDLFGEDFDFVDEDELDEEEQDGDDSESSDLEDSELDDSELDDRDADKQETQVEHAQQRSSKEKEPAASAEDRQEKPPARGKRRPRRGKSASTTSDSKQSEGSEEVPVGALDEAAEPETQDASGNREEAEVVPEGPPTDHVVHVYELGKFKRTIQREFTAEDAEAFAVEYNRTSKPYSRSAIAISRADDPAASV